ncbi:Fur family transcriptional regulator [Aquibaculum sediminis]|uniref:Fur family transcriptional regulator n=1 Tax=Aquibaculum sediminis TaxID=3231907 RepID=UPI003455FA03
MTTPGFHDPVHDHERCLAEALQEAEQLCRDRGAQLTPVRRRVLELVWSEHRPQGAYELLEQLQAERGRVAPPTVYRALDFLLAQGLIHRIESLNAFVGCPRPSHVHNGQFFICEACGATAELTDSGLAERIDRSAAALGFAVNQRIVEVRGHCPDCTADESQSP